MQKLRSATETADDLQRNNSKAASDQHHRKKNSLYIHKSCLTKVSLSYRCNQISTCQRIHSNTYSHVCHIIFLVYILKAAYIFITEILSASIGIKILHDLLIGIRNIFKCSLNGLRMVMDAYSVSF